MMKRNEIINNIKSLSIDRLTERDKQIVKMRNARMMDGEKNTYKEIGDKFGISANRVRCINICALRRINYLLKKHSDQKINLDDLLKDL